MTVFLDTLQRINKEVFEPIILKNLKMCQILEFYNKIISLSSLPHKYTVLYITFYKNCIYTYISVLTYSVVLNMFKMSSYLYLLYHQLTYQHYHLILLLVLIYVFSFHHLKKMKKKMIHQHVNLFYYDVCKFLLLLNI